MAGGTLLVSRYINWFSQFKTRLEALGFPDVHVTGNEKDGLNMLINELKPDYLLISSNFYDCGTPYMVGQMLDVFPGLNIAVINASPFSDAIAAWFIFHGIKFYVKLGDGRDEFRRGLKCVLDGIKYIAPDLKKIIDGFQELPAVPRKSTRRQREVLLMLCKGCSIKCIQDKLHICKATVEKHIKALLIIFNSRNKEELINTVHCLEIFTKKELGICVTENGCDNLPDWVRAQRKINKIANNK